MVLELVSTDHKCSIVEGSTHMIWLMYLICMRCRKTIVLVEHYCLDIYPVPAIRAFLPWESFREWNWKLIERGDCMLRQAQSRVSKKPENIKRAGDIHCRLRVREWRESGDGESTC